MPYDDALLPVVKAYKAKPLPAVFVQYEDFFEAELLKRDMPMEMKYLPMALSDMKVNSEQDDRCGVWSMPLLIALRQGLAIDANVDERFSVEASTLAVLDYLCDLNRQYDNWWLSILAYANGPTALHHAMMKQDRWLDLWDVYKEKALANARIVADFMACCCVYGSDDRIVADPIEDEQKDWTKRKAAMPIVEQVTVPVFAPRSESPAVVQSAPSQSIVKYTVRKGDTLSKIAQRYHVKVSQIMKWNNLKDDRIQIGQKLIVKK